MKMGVRSKFRFDELLAMGAATLGCSGIVGITVGVIRGAPPAVLGASILFLVVAVAMCLLRRQLRQRARAELMWWLPQARTEDSAKMGWGGDWQGLWRRDEVLGDDGRTSGLQMARPGAATRAVLASLHDAIRAEVLGRRKPRPACRRARLRALGRESDSRRRGHLRRNPARPRS